MVCVIDNLLVNYKIRWSNYSIAVTTVTHWRSFNLNMDHPYFIVWPFFYSDDRFGQSGFLVSLYMDILLNDHAVVE